MNCSALSLCQTLQSVLAMYLTWAGAGTLSTWGVQLTAYIAAVLTSPAVSRVGLASVLCPHCAGALVSDQQWDGGYNVRCYSFKSQELTVVGLRT